MLFLYDYLVIQTIFLLESIVLYPYITSKFVLNPIALNNIVLSFILPFSIGWTWKKYHTKSVNHTNTIRLLNSIKRNKEVFDVLINNKIEIVDKTTMQNTQIEEVTIVSNPFCKPCSFATNEVIILYNVYGFKINIIYAVSEDSESKDYKVAKYLLQYKKKYGEEEYLKHIRKWYKDGIKNWADFIQNSDFENNDIELLLQKHAAWCKQTQVNYTPLILINDKVLPSIYNIQDIKYLI